MYNENLYNLLEQIKENLRETKPQSFYDAWADTFTIDEIGDNTIVIGYHGHAPFSKFKKECKDVLWSEICLMVGYRENVKILDYTKPESEKPLKKAKEPKPKIKEALPENTNVKKNIKAIKLLAVAMIFAVIAASIGIVMCSYIENRNFREIFYNVSSLKVNNTVRIIQISDLHNCQYGKNNQKLIERIKKLEPDIIICTGDIVDSSDSNTEQIEHMGKELSEVAPLYFIYGNNEVESVYDIPLNQTDLDKKFSFTDETRDETALLALPDELELTLEKSGYKVLKNEKDTLTVGTTEIDIYGVLTSNPSSFWTYTSKSYPNYIYEDTDNLKITATHEPFIYEVFTPDYWGDLMLCGHTHGGEIRVPILGPLYTKEGGLFPERKDCYVYGRYDVAGRPLIISAGLDNTNLLRINNQPELVVIDINKF